MKKIFLSSLLVFFYLFITAQLVPASREDKKLTLQQCVETALNNNFDVQQRGLQAQTAEVNWKQAKLNLLPDLNGSASHGISQGRSIDPFTNSYINEQYNYANYGLSSGVTLFQGLSAQNLIKQNSLSYQASKMDWQQAKDNATINIILAYLQVLNNEDILAQAQNQAEYSQKQVERLEILNKEGAIAPSLLSDLRGQYANDQLAIINSKNALETSKITLSQLMNVPYDKNMELEKINPETLAVKYEVTPENIYQTALQQFAQIKAVDLRKQSTEAAVKVARGQLFPRLTFNANANTNYSSAASQSILLNTTDVASTDYVVVNGTQTPVIKKQSNFSSSKISYNSQLNNNLYNVFNLNLNIPIFNSLFQRNQIKLAKINVKNSDLVAKTTKTQLQQSIEQAYVNMTSAADRYKTLLEQVAAYEESFGAAEIRFNSGVGTSIDYLTAKNNLDRANINLITAKYDYVLRTKILDYYQGKQLW
jgi:outer membrane protein